MVVALLLQAIWTGPAGGGMLSVQEPAVATKGHGAVGTVMDNYDRDPWGLDINELRASFRFGLGHRWEVYSSYYFSRAVTIPGGQHPVPTSPMDMVVVSGPQPIPPYRPIYWPLPYVGQTSSGVDDMIPGDIVLGFKRQLAQQHGKRPALSVSANIIAPGSNSIRYLHRGSDSASIDGAFHAAAGWAHGRWTFAANLGYIRSGSLSQFNDDRIVTNEGVTRLQLDRPDFIRIAGGARLRRSKRTSWIAELYHLGPIGSRTPTLESVGATDALLGIQMDVWRLTLTAGIRQHMFSPPDHALRPTGVLEGAVDLSGTPRDQQVRYLNAVGAPRYEPGNPSLLVIGAPTDVPLPEGARRLPDTYVTRTKGNVGTIFHVALRF
jgi:hypothetical protein